MPTTYRGKIKEFGGSWQSGLGQLTIERADGLTVAVPCENGATVRALDGCFGDVIGAGHTASIPEHAQDVEVVYSVDDFGILLGFTPVAEWEGPEIPNEGVEE
jgi:hypothetical protein